MLRSKIGAMRPNAQHLHHSHAHEEDLPGTVNLVAVEGDDVAYGQALFPVPAEDPNDPLQWGDRKKTMILVVCAIYSFLGNSALIGIGPYLVVFSAEFGVSETEASNLLTYPSLAFGFGSLILVPLYLKFGRRPVMLGSMIFFICGLIGTSQSTTFGGLMAARCVCAFGSGVCEALPIQLVNDIFFLHERGKRIGYYTACLCLATISPLPAGYMLTAGYTWHLFFYVVLAFAVALFIMTFFVVEETSYDRKAIFALGSPAFDGKAIENRVETTGSEPNGGISPPARKSFVQTLSIKGRVDHSVPFFMTMVRSFSYFLVPQVMWVITTFGIIIGLGSFVVNFTFPIKIIAPPYLWDISSSGLIALGPTIGYILAIPLASSSDRLAAYLTRKNHGIREAEMRLGVLLIPMLIGPAGLVLYGFTAEKYLHWIGYFLGSFFMAWSSFFYFSFTIAYAVDSYFANTSEMLIAMNIGKQAISFGFGFEVVTWVMESGYAVVVAGIFGGVLLANNLALVLFMVWGNDIRRFMSRTWIARLHRESAG